MSEQQIAPPATPEPPKAPTAVPAVVPTPPASQPAATGSPEKQPPWGKPENFDADEAWKTIQNLRKEKGGANTDALEAQVKALTDAQESQKKALAEALGLTEPPKSEDALAETVKSLQAQFLASQREATILRLAAEKNIPAEYHDLLTETDPEKLAAQAEKVSALVVAKAAAEGTPAFQANPGQGQGASQPAQDNSYPAHWLPQKQQ